MIDMHWVWLIVGIALIGLEIIVPGFVIMFFGLAAVAVGVLCWFFPAMPETIQLLLFSILSFLMVWIMRKMFKKTFSGKNGAPEEVDDVFTGQHATVARAIEPGAPGKVTFNGTDWQAQSDQALAVGTRVRIVRRDNITLTVQP